MRRSESEVRRRRKGGLAGGGPAGADTFQAPSAGNGQESDIGQPRTNPEQGGKRAPEAVRRSKTGHTLVTSQRQLNKPPCCYAITAVDISPHPSTFIIKLHLRDSP